jgi:hypothetical protein
VEDGRADRVVAVPRPLGEAVGVLLEGHEHDVRAVLGNPRNTRLRDGAPDQVGAEGGELNLSECRNARANRDTANFGTRTAYGYSGDCGAVPEDAVTTASICAWTSASAH